MELVVDSTRTKYGYSLVILVFPPTFDGGYRKTASQIAMKLRVYITNPISVF